MVMRDQMMTIIAMPRRSEPREKSGESCQGYHSFTGACFMSYLSIGTEHNAKPPHKFPVRHAARIGCAGKAQRWR